jgi:hypothetical protein
MSPVELFVFIVEHLLHLSKVPGVINPAMLVIVGI